MEYGQDIRSAIASGGAYAGKSISSATVPDIQYQGISELRKWALEVVGGLESEIAMLRERVATITVQLPATVAKDGVGPMPSSSDAVSDLRHAFARVYELSQNIRYIRQHLDI